MDIKVGDIIFCCPNSDPIYPLKPKYAVVASVVNKWCFMINTANREHYHCLPISEQNHPSFLKHDSFIGCSRFFKYEINEVKRIVGNLSELERNALRLHLSGSRTLSEINKKIIVSELGLKT